MPTVIEKEAKKAVVPSKRVAQSPDFKIVDKQIIQNPDVKLVDKGLDSYIENNTPIGYLHRILYDKNVHSLQQKSAFIHKGIINAKLQGFFPYDRIIKNGSRQNGVIQEKGSADKSNCLIWTNNLYLGLNQHPRVIKAAQEATKIYGTGSGTSALSGGFCEIHAELINIICGLTNKEDAILFSTGFTANQGFIGSIASPGDLILFDRDCHASLIDGINISGANSLSFKHNNAPDLELKLEKNKGKYRNVFVIIESVYSMSGDEAPLKAISELKKRFPFFLYVDEAHSFGFYEENALGYCAREGCQGQVDFLMSTFSKTTASIGGFVATTREFASYVRTKSRPYLFQATIPPASIATILEAIHIIKTEPHHVKKLWENTIFMRTELIKAGFDLGSGKSPILALFVSDNDILAQLSNDLYHHNIFTNWVSYPMVPVNKGRLRLIVTSMHSEEDIINTIKILSNLGRKHKLI